MKKANQNQLLRVLDPVVKERKSDALRRSVIDTFIAHVGTIGFEQTTLDRIAEDLGMRRNHVGYYFPSRRKLLGAAVERVISLGQKITIQKIQHARTPEEAFEAWVGAAFDWLELFPHHGKVMLVFYSQCPFDKDFARLNSEIFEIGTDRIFNLLLSQGLSVSNKKLLKQALREVQTFNLGIIVQRLSSLKPESWTEVKSRAIQHAQFCIKPLKPRKKKA